MEQKEFERYINERYNDQCQWYSSKANFNKKRYYLVQTMIICFSSLTTLTIALGIYFPKFEWIRILALGMTSAVTVLVSLQKVFRFQENWHEYRNTAESLKKEKYLHLASLDEYAKNDSINNLFVERVEGLISRQNTAWSRRSYGNGKDNPTN